MGLWDKIGAGFSLANKFKEIIFKAICSPKQSTIIAYFGAEIKNIFADESKDKADKICAALDTIVAFRREKREDYKEIFVILEKILDEYEKNSKDIKAQLKTLLADF